MKKILIFVVIFVMIMTSACSKPEDNEIATSIDENVQADQSNDTDDTKTEQTNDETISDLSEKDPEKYNNQEKTEENKVNTEVTDNEQENTTENESSDLDKNMVAEQPVEENTEPTYDDSDATPASSFEYSVDKDKKRVSIIKFIGNEKEVVIPNYIEGYPVKSLGMFFCNTDSSVELVIIPENIEIIHEQAFYGCKNLKTVITKSENLVIKRSAFESCSSLNNLILGEGVVEVGASVFRHCTSLRNIHIPSTLNKCGTGAFGGITIERLTFADGIETIGSSSCFVPAYGECTENSFKTVIIPASVKTIATYSFGENLQEITFLGDAPELVGEEEWFPKNVIIKYMKGTKGWDDPKWKSFNLVETK